MKLTVYCCDIQLISVEHFYNLSFSAKSWQNPASIDMQWVATIECLTIVYVNLKHHKTRALFIKGVNYFDESCLIEVEWCFKLDNTTSALVIIS